MGLAGHLVAKLRRHILDQSLGPDDLLFPMPDLTHPRRRSRPAQLPDPATLGLTEPTANGRRYPHGTPTAYGAGRCRCRYCRDAVAAYRARRRATGKDHPRPTRLVDTDGHISNDWFRANIWNKALTKSKLPIRATPHALRHAHVISPAKTMRGTSIPTAIRHVPHKYPVLVSHVPASLWRPGREPAYQTPRARRVCLPEPL
jgi:hypothetical protein